MSAPDFIPAGHRVIASGFWKCQTCRKVVFGDICYSDHPLAGPQDVQAKEAAAKYICPDCRWEPLSMGAGI